MARGRSMWPSSLRLKKSRTDWRSPFAMLARSALSNFEITSLWPSKIFSWLSIWIRLTLASWTDTLDLDTQENQSFALGGGAVVVPVRMLAGGQPRNVRLG